MWTTANICITCFYNGSFTVGSTIRLEFMYWRFQDLCFKLFQMHSLNHQLSQISMLSFMLSDYQELNTFVTWRIRNIQLDDVIIPGGTRPNSWCLGCCKYAGREFVYSDTVLIDFSQYSYSVVQSGFDRCRFSMFLWQYVEVFWTVI